MTLSNLNSPKGWIGLTLAAAVIGVSAWGATQWRGNGDQVAVPKELTVEGIKANATDPGRAMDAMRATMDRTDLTDEQREQVRRNMREVWEQSMTERVEEYYAASEEDKVAVLDKHIDEMEAWRKAWEERRAEREKDGADGDRGPRGPMGSQTREERKERSESRDPDKTARQMAYFMAIQGRMAQRGIKSFFGRGGGDPAGSARTGSGNPSARRGP
jgi:hypothetical protein